MVKKNVSTVVDSNGVPLANTAPPHTSPSTYFLPTINLSSPTKEISR